MPLITINDNSGNPINLGNTINVPTNGKIKGDSKSTYPLTGKVYPKGYTPQVDYVIDPTNLNKQGLPVELGEYPDFSKSKKTLSTKESSDKVRSDSQNFNDGLSDFKHTYDYVFDEKNNASTKIISEDPYASNSLYLGGYVHTGNDNEDPTVFGYDVIIDLNSSPLFNGALLSFLQTYSSMAELSSRIEIYRRFYEIFFRVFKVNDSTNVTSLQTKTHYLKKITGLNNLTDTINFESTKFLTEYGTDLITLTINEDVSLLISEMVYLYKTLVGTKRNGKQLIPPNLLRFNCDIVVSEVRRFKRVYKILTSSSVKEGDNIQQVINGTGITYTSAGEGDGFSPIGESTNYIPNTLQDIKNNAIEKMAEINDLISKVRYSLYECTFFMPILAHDDMLDLSEPVVSEGIELSFMYKYTSSVFEKITWEYDNKMEYKPKVVSISNNSYDLQLSESEKNYSTTDRNILETDIWEIYTRTNLLDDIVDSPIQQMLKNESLLNSPVETLKKKLIAALSNEVNRRIIKRMRLVNDAFDKIRNSVGLGKMSEPTNIYDADYYDRMLTNDIQNAARDFLGNSIRNALGGR